MIDLQPGYILQPGPKGSKGILACLGVVTSPPYLVTTKLLVTTPLSMGCNLSVWYQLCERGGSWEALQSPQPPPDWPSALTIVYRDELSRETVEVCHKDKLKTVSAFSTD